MSKRRILELFETNGRGQSGLAAALPGQLHSQSACLVPTRSSNRPAQQHWSEELVKLIGGLLPDPLGHPAVPTQVAIPDGGRVDHAPTRRWAVRLKFCGNPRPDLPSEVPGSPEGGWSSGVPGGGWSCDAPWPADRVSDPSRGADLTLPCQVYTSLCLSFVSVL
jgi:hypothetical protein